VVGGRAKKVEGGGANKSFCDPQLQRQSQVYDVNSRTSLSLRDGEGRKKEKGKSLVLYGDGVVRDSEGPW